MINFLCEIAKNTVCVNVYTFKKMKIYTYTMFGMSRKEEPEEEDIGEYQKYNALLWTAPELLRLGETRPFYGTQKRDVFSFAIIMHGILYKEQPYFLETTTPKGWLYYAL